MTLKIYLPNWATHRTSYSSGLCIAWRRKFIWIRRKEKTVTEIKIDTIYNFFFFLTDLSQHQIKVKKLSHLVQGWRVYSRKSHSSIFATLQIQEIQILEKQLDEKKKTIYYFDRKMFSLYNSNKETERNFKRLLNITICGHKNE